MTASIIFHTPPGAASFEGGEGRRYWRENDDIWLYRPFDGKRVLGTIVGRALNLSGEFEIADPMRSELLQNGKRLGFERVE